MSSKSFIGLALAAMALSPAMLEGCSSSGGNPLCCNEFKIGAQVDVQIGGTAASQVAVQAVADVAGLASAAIDNLTTACRGIATDLGAAQADQDAANGAGDKNKVMNAWCKLAVGSINGALKGGAKLNINFKPPVCEASISAKLDCQAKCSGTAKCDVVANPPKCTGGTLNIDCKGECSATATSPTFQCEGSCSGTCSGECTAQGGVAVDCTGKCDGTCAAGGSAGGTGIQADGTCKGTCQGKCTATATAPAIKCQGSCNGKCDAKCTATPGQASVKCDGKCAVEATPISCTGGKLEGGCKVDAKCDANCNGSVQAKAECTPAKLDITASADGLVKLIATLEANLPIIFDIKTRFEAIGKLAGNIDVTAATDIKAACLLPVASAAAQAAGDLADASSASLSVTASVGQ